MHRLHPAFLTMCPFLFLLVVALHCAPATAQPLRVLTAGAFKQVVVSCVPAFDAAHDLARPRQGHAAAAVG